jgi:hypothetical protein
VLAKPVADSVASDVATVLLLASLVPSPWTKRQACL